MQLSSIDGTPQLALPNNIKGLAQESQHQLKALQRELGEITMLVKQTSSEIERLGGRAADTGRKLRELETNMDNFSRQEIRDILSSAQEAELRVFMMKGQLEMLVHKQGTLERMRSLLQSIVDIGATEPIDGQVSEEGTVALCPQPTGNAAGPQGPIVAQIIQAQEDERQRIARQLHDGPAQALTNLILRAEICQKMLDMSPDEARSELAGLKEMIVNTLQETRRFIFDLRPMILDDLGLIPTLRRQVQIVASRSHIPIRLSVTGGERRMTPPAEVIVFRVVQEALDNAVRHGKATEIQVSADIAIDAIKVAIEDNGTGFDVAKAMATSSERKALGLRRMQEQVSTIGGEMAFESSPSQGSKVTVKVPA